MGMKSVLSFFKNIKTKSYDMVSLHQTIKDIEAECKVSLKELLELKEQACKLQLEVNTNNTEHHSESPCVILDSRVQELVTKDNKQELLLRKLEINMWDIDIKNTNEIDKCLSVLEKLHASYLKFKEECETLIATAKAIISAESKQVNIEEEKSIFEKINEVDTKRPISPRDLEYLEI